MNYFEHHIGDYDSATAHLSWLEDCAYRRLICLYYRTEAPIPVDLKQVFRLLRASSKQEREAIEQVLGEFFELDDDGYHQLRCDREIAEYAETIPERKAKRENDRERQQRTRERRKRLFEALRAHNIVPAYDTKTAALESLLSQAQSRNESRVVTPHVTCDNTATHLPSPTTQLIHSEPGGSGSAGAPPDPADVIFGLGLPLLTAAGVSDRNARSMLGMQRKQHGDQAVIEALQRCATEKPMQPVPWLQAALKARIKPTNRQSAIEEENRRVALEWANGSAP